MDITAMVYGKLRQWSFARADFILVTVMLVYVASRKYAYRDIQPAIWKLTDQATIWY